MYIYGVLGRAILREGPQLVAVRQQANQVRLVRAKACDVQTGAQGRPG